MSPPRQAGPCSCRIRRLIRRWLCRHPLASCYLLRLIPAGCSPAGTVAASSGPSGYRLFGHTATVGVDRCGRGQRQVSGTVDRHRRRRFRLHPPARLIDATSERRLSLRSRSSNVAQRPRNRFRSRRNLAATVAVAAAAPPPLPSRGGREGWRKGGGPRRRKGASEGARER